MLRTRFAPSPTGLMHTGNAYSAIQCEQWAKAHQAELLLRIEDIDFTRCRPELAVQMIDDLQWLGISFAGNIIYQHQRLHLYQQALDTLINMGVLYPCFCTRKQVQANLQKMNMSSDVLDNYPGTCKTLSEMQRSERMLREPYSWRLDVQAVHLAQPLFWQDVAGNAFDVDLDYVGDVIIGRKDIQYSYHLAVVVDDADQQITHVIRGEDLRTSTPVHRILQYLLGYEPPIYHHHALIKDEQGERLAKIKQSITLQNIRQSGMTVAKFREKMIKKGAVEKQLL